MYWNYRIVVHEDPESGEDYYSLHEVYYDDDGVPNGCTVEPISFGGESLAEVRKMLEFALRDIDRNAPLRWSKIVEPDLSAIEGTSAGGE